MNKPHNNNMDSLIATARSNKVATCDLRLCFPNNLDINLVVKEGFRTELKAIQSKRDFINITEFIRIDIAYTLVFIGVSF